MALEIQFLVLDRERMWRFNRLRRSQPPPLDNWISMAIHIDFHHYVLITFLCILGQIQLHGIYIKWLVQGYSALPLWSKTRYILLTMLGIWRLMPLSIIFQLYRCGGSVLLMEETRVNNSPATHQWQTLSQNVISSRPCYSVIWTHNISGDRHRLHK